MLVAGREDEQDVIKPKSLHAGSYWLGHIGDFGPP